MYRDNCVGESFEGQFLEYVNFVMDAYVLPLKCI